MSSGIPRVEDLLETASNTCAQTEFVTNSALEGGAVNRPFTFILKTCPAHRMLIRAWPAFL